ncbi:hypothetical protein C6P42_000436 [Pichia californica]|nr:hypothetical protein C6P42_000436 [[Candida] californica]
MSRNVLKNRYSVEIPTDISRETMLDYTTNLEVAIFEGAIEDHADLHKAKALTMEHEHAESASVSRTLQEIVRILDAQNTELRAFRTEMNTIRADMNAQFDGVRWEMRRMNYRTSVLENQRLLSLGQSIEVVPFIFGDGPLDTLPPIMYISDIYEMDENTVVTYIRGYYIGRIPATLLGKKKKLAELVGLGTQKDSIRG